MDLPCNGYLPQCDEIMAALFDDSGLGMDFDFRNDGTLSPTKPTTPLRIRKKKRFSSETGTYSRQSTGLAAALSKNAADCVLSHSNVVGDGSSVCRLPIVFDSRHDLKCISPETLAGVIKGSYSIGSYRIIDCRYPYEYTGGHILNADNRHQFDDIDRFLTQSTSKSPLLIFHCEFSIERGPAMCRRLRQKDREANAENYPDLFYPEIYLLQGGYKAFYERYPELCTPEGYTPMLHQSHAKDLRHFQRKSKSWCVGQDGKQRKSIRLFD